MVCDAEQNAELSPIGLPLAMTILATNTPYAPPLPPLTPARGVSLNLSVGMPTPLQRINVRATAAPRARASLAKLRSQPAAFASPRKLYKAAARPEGVPSNYATLLRIEHAMATPRGASTAPRLATPMDQPSSTPGLDRRMLLEQELEQKELLHRDSDLSPSDYNDDIEHGGRDSDLSTTGFNMFGRPTVQHGRRVSV